MSASSISMFVRAMCRCCTKHLCPAAEERSVDREEQELRELARREVVVADEHERAAAVGQGRPDRHPLDVVERDAERAQVEEERLVHRLGGYPDEAVDSVQVV